jgi:hypothetical protein
MKNGEEEAGLIKQEAALKVSRNLLTMKKDLEVAEHGLDADKMVLDFENSDLSSKASKTESESRNGTDKQFLTMRYIAEIVMFQNLLLIQTLTLILTGWTRMIPFLH